MLNHTQAAPPRLKQRGFSFFIGVIASLTLMTILSSNAQAATPLAGSVISNQASASYTDTGGSPQTATSNSVTTTVAQVGSYTLTADNTKTAAPGTTVYMPHILTNTGNGADTFYVTLPTAIDSNLSGVAIYADVNGDGQPDSPTPICTVGGAPACTGTNVSTGSLASGGSFKFVVAMTVKSTAADAVTISEVATAVPDNTTSWYSTYSPNSINNTDTLTVANNVPVFAVNKSIISSLTSGPSGTQVTYKLAYTNSGNAAGPLYINDVMGSGATNGFSYVASSAKWSVSGATALDDATGATGDPAGIEYQAVTTGTGLAAQTTITALIANVPANASGFITFTVNVDTDAPLGTSETTNVASYARANNSTDCGTIAACTTTPPTTITTTNPSPFTVTGTYSVVANNNTGSSTDENDDNAATGVNVVTAAATAPNTVVSFSNIIWNTGTASDTFNITYDASNAGATGSPTNFPTGTTFQLFKSDGVTPLTSSDADGVPDTGPVAPGVSYTVVLKASIPANACNLVDCTTASNFTVTKIAASKADPSKTNKVFDQLAAITPPSVDLTNAGDLGQGPGSVNSPAITNVNVAPGQTAYFNLNVSNGGLANDNYNLAYQVIDTTGGDLADASAFSANSLPAGWSVSFHVNTAGAGACSAGTLGAVVNNTGVIAPSTTKNLCAVVNTPSGASALAGLYRTYFRVLSTATGASDIKLDSVTLNAVNSLTLTPPGSGQIQPGGTITYPHTLANGGNSSCGKDFTFNVSNSQAASGWSYTLYFDTNGNGAVDSGEPVIGGSTNATDSFSYTLTSDLTAGSNVKLLVKVQAPSGATSGSVDAISITATAPAPSTCGTTTPIADNTTILAGQIRLIKTQALGTWAGSDCGTAPVASSFASTVLSQKPGDCVWYKVVATNEGDAAVTSVAINDATPSYTTYGGGGSCVGGTAPVAGVTLSGAGATSTGSSGSVICSTWGTINPSETAQLLFSVRINP